MLRRLFALLLLASLVVASLPIAPAGTSSFEAQFQTEGGNEWWVQVDVDANQALDGVDARVDGGEWRALEKKWWGDWARSLHAPEGAMVEFRAHSAQGDAVVSGQYVWTSGKPASGGGGLAATFDPKGGNEWWVQVGVDADERLTGVHARVNGGSWQALEKKSWGDWAATLHAPDGSRVEFRATGSSGAIAISGAYEWPSGRSLGGSAFGASFSTNGGNEWWVQVDVDADAPLAGVDARVNGGSWRALELKSWGEWADSFHVPDGSIVEFRAHSDGGATATSAKYRWPTGELADGTSSGGGGSGGSGDIDVRVRAWANPHGSSDPVEIDRRFYGLNIADWHSYDYHPDTDWTFTRYLEALSPGVLRWPAGHSSQSYQWERAPEAQGASSVLTAEHVDSFIALAREVGAEPLIAVNLKTGTPEAAADLVRYVNIEKGHGVTWWQIGNEPDHRDGLTDGPWDYASRYLEFARAMEEVDPSIKLVGGEIMTGAHVVGSNGARDWMTPILEHAGHEIDAVSWHYYALDSGQPSTSSSAYPTVENLLQEEAPDWRPSSLAFADEVFPHLDSVRDQHAWGAEIWVTEMAQDSGAGGAEGIVDRWAGALWTADVMGRFATHGPDAITKFVYKSGSSHQYTLLDENYEPRPEYYVYWLLANHYGDRIVDAGSSDIYQVAAHASLRDDGQLAVLLVNKREQSHDISLTLEGFDPSSAKQYTILGSSYDDRTVTINGEKLSTSNVRSGVGSEWAEAGKHTVVHMPPLSVKLLVFSR